MQIVCERGHCVTAKPISKGSGLMTDRDQKRETHRRRGLGALFAMQYDEEILQEVLVSDADFSPSSSRDVRSFTPITPTTPDHSKSDGSAADVTAWNTELFEPIDDDVPFDPWDDRTPEQKAAYGAEVERLAELARDVPFGEDER